jgi:ABC-type transport system involved in multi-copper enzyme maturation permease subunit
MPYYYEKLNLWFRHRLLGYRFISYSQRIISLGFERRYSKYRICRYDPVFTLAPWILIFLIPAVTMRSFSSEKKAGTLELLNKTTLSLWQIVNGKFLGAVLLM